MPVVCVTGAPKCGLSALAQAWRARFDKPIVHGKTGGLDRTDAEALSLSGACVDDADALNADEALLTLINRVSAGPGRLLLTSHTLPAHWKTSSADLRSRLKSMPVAEILAPDDAMVRGRLRAAGERHFLKLDDETVNFIVPRLELSYEAVETTIDAISVAVTETGRGPTVPLVRDVLSRLGRLQDITDKAG